MNKTLIVANRKMNPKTAAEAQELFDTVAQGIEGGEKAVTVVKTDGSRKNVLVVTGSIGNDGTIEVISGLSEGDRIVMKKTK